MNAEQLEHLKSIREEYERELESLRKNIKEFSDQNAKKDHQYLAMIRNRDDQSPSGEGESLSEIIQQRTV